MSILYSLAWMSSKPSPYACIIPYSMPLWTILMKWPAPLFPKCAQPFGGASVSSTGFTRCTAACLAADHHAVAVLESPHAAGDADVQVVEAERRVFLGAADGVAEVRVRAVDQDVALAGVLRELVERVIRGLAGRDHRPHDARWPQLLSPSPRSCRHPRPRRSSPRRPGPALRLPATTRWPPRTSRVTMLPPMRPSPYSPISMPSPPWCDRGYSF